MRAIIPNKRVRRLLKKGDLLLEKSGGGDLQPVGVVMSYEHDDLAVCSNFIARMTVASPHISRYLTYLHSHLYALKVNVRSIKQTTGIQNLDSYSYLCERIALPPSNEQTAIARFLDYATKCLEHRIRAKEKLITLLEEHKQVLVHEAVTGGIDVRTGKAYPAYKPAGVEWLGVIPKDWDLVALRHLGVKFGSGVTPRGGAAIYTKRGALFLRSQNIHFDGLRLAGAARIPMAMHENLSGTHVKSGDILLNITGASIGRVALVPEPFTDANVNQHVCIIRPRQNLVLPQFLAAYLSTPSIQNVIQIEQSGASREGLTLNSIRSLMVALPPLDVQKAIVRVVQTEQGKMATATDATTDEIRFLREYRTRLISDVVTGKFDVREAASALVAEPDAPEGRGVFGKSFKPHR